MFRTFIFIIISGSLLGNSCRNNSLSAENDTSIPFETFSSFERMEGGDPLLGFEAPDWAAAAHALIVRDTIHYFWSKRDGNNYWDLRHSYAPVDHPTKITHDSRNPILIPPEVGMDSKSIEYPCPFYNSFDKKYYMYYLVKEDKSGYAPKQTGLLVSEGDLGKWERVLTEPVIRAEFEHEKIVAGHTSVAIVEDTIHIIYTGLTSYQHKPTICYATAPLSRPWEVTKDPANPIFRGSGAAWDAYGVREAELLKGPEYFHVFYGGRNEDRVFQVGHVRTVDFRSFEANPNNPIVTAAGDGSSWDSDGLLTPQVFKAGADYYMLYAGVKGKNWGQDGHCATGLLKVSK